MSRTPATPGRARRATAAATAAALAATGGALVLAPSTSTASSHREAPLTAASPLIDNTDTYAFVSPDKPDSVTLIANWTGFQDPTAGPNFWPWGSDGYRYNIKVDNNGDAKPDLTFRATFTDIDKRTGETFLYNNGVVNSFNDPTLLFKQTYDLDQIDAAGNVTSLLKDQEVAPSYVGEASMPNYKALRDEAVTAIGGTEAGTAGGAAFVGQADDPFFLDLRVFDLLYGGDLSETGNASLSGMNVNTIALQMPIANLTRGGDDSGIIGVWSTTDQQTMQLGAGTAEPVGDFVQVSRLGAPLVNEVVLPIGLKNAFNNLLPQNDATVMAAVDRVKDPEVPKLIEAIYKIPAPPAPRDDLVAAFLTGIQGVNQPPKVTPAEMIRLNTKTPVTASPDRLGLLAKDTQGFPNGRRLIDDVVDIELQALEGAIISGELVEAIAAGDGVDENDLPFDDAFPYVALPHSGSGPSSAGFAEGGSTSAEESPSPSATPAEDEGEGEDVDASPVSSESDGVSTGLLIGAAVLALLIGLVVGALVARRRGSDTSTA